MAAAKGKQGLPILVQVKISRRAAGLLRKRAKRVLRTQASHLRAVIYRDLGLIDVEGCSRVWDQDANAARNLLHRRGLSRGPVPPTPNASGFVPPTNGKALAQDKRGKRHENAGRGPRQNVEDTPI